MAPLGKENPQGGPPGLLKAQEKIQERLELVETGKKEPKIFKEKMKEQKGKPENPGKGNGKNNDDTGFEETNDDTNGGQYQGTPGNDNGNGPGGD